MKPSHLKALPCGKRDRYPTLVAAKDSWKVRSGGHAVDPQCEHCAGWHLSRIAARIDELKRRQVAAEQARSQAIRERVAARRQP